MLDIHTEGRIVSPNRREAAGDDFAALVDAAMAGHRSAVNELLRVLKPDIVRYCRARIGRTQGTFATADDVAQEALLGVYQALTTYGDKGARFRAFVYGIARNKVFDHYRKISREQHAQLDDAPDVPDPRPGPESAALRDERAARVSELLSYLSDYQREVLVLRLAVGYSAEETARALSTTPGAVRVAQARALAALRKYLENEDDEE